MMFSLLVAIISLAYFFWMAQAAQPKPSWQNNDLVLDKEGFNKVKEIHRNWYFFALKALLGQLAKELLSSIDSASRERLKHCLKRIAYTKNLRKTATCLPKAREQWKNYIKSRSLSKSSSEQHSFVQYREGRLRVTSTRKKLLAKDQKCIPAPCKIGEQEIRKQALEASVQLPRPQRIKRSLNRLTLPEHLGDDKNYLKVESSRHLPPLRGRTPKSPTHRVADLFVSLFGKAAVDELPKKWSSTYKSLRKLSKTLESNEQLPGARVYNTRIFDIVMDNKNSKPDNQVPVPALLKNAFDIVKSFTGGDSFRILSPRIAPLLPDKTSKGFLSPSLFPFYKDETEQHILPVPTILETAGLGEKDRERVLEMVMEVSGARETVDKAMTVLHHLNSVGMDEKLFSVNEKIGKVFEQLRSSFTSHQSNELDKRGFTFMSPNQMEKLHRDQALNEPVIREQMNKYKRVPPREREEFLWETVAELAGRRKRRRKRQLSFQPIVVLKPLVLSPYQFAPIYGFSILGPTVLSPNIFSPLILNPAVLGPWVLSPAFPLPFIISPYVLTPYVLSPLGMAPFVFSPYVLSPNVITPYFLSPLILSPVVVSPDVLSPMVLGGAILSPGILSPSILSKSFLMANVLSPTLLS